MTDKEQVKKPCPKDTEEKKDKTEKDEKKAKDETKIKTEVIPQWGLDLKAGLDRVIDLFERKQEDVDEDKKPVDEKKQDDDEKKPVEEDETKKQDEKPVDEDKKPVEEKKQDDDEKPVDEEEKKKALTDLVKSTVKEAVEKLGTVTIAKRGKIGDGKPAVLDMFAMHGISWSQIHKASGFPDVGGYDLTQVPGWNGQSSILIRTRNKES